MGIVTHPSPQLNNNSSLSGSVIMSFLPVKCLLHICTISHDVYYSVCYNAKITSLCIHYDYYLNR